MKVFIAHSARDVDLVGAVVAHFLDEGHEAVRPDQTRAPADFLSEVSAAVRSADVVVAILSEGGDPETYYDLGLAAGANVPTLVAARSSEVLSASIASVPFVQLSGDLTRDAQSISRRAKDLVRMASPRRINFSSAEDALQAANQDPAVLEALAPAEFERLVEDLFRQRGYVVASTSSGGDAGADLLVQAPEDGQLLLVEVKKLSGQSRVSVEAVRNLISNASLLSGALGILVSTAGFTSAASALAKGAPVLLRSLGEILAAKSKRDLIEAESEK